MIPQIEQLETRLSLSSSSPFIPETYIYFAQLPLVLSGTYQVEYTTPVDEEPIDIAPTPTYYPLQGSTPMGGIFSKD